MKNLIKSAEIYGSEAIVYNGSKAPPDLYIDLIVNNKLKPGMGAGDLYGKGVYTTYNLSGTATAGGTYGGFVYKLKVNLYGFISFNPDIAKKIYGEDLAPSQQYEKIYGRRDYIFKELIALESAERFSQFSSDLADPASKFLRGRVKGLIFTGRNDGDVAVIYDPLTVVPIAWKKTGDSSWSSFDKDQIKPAIGRGISGSFEKLKYDEVDASKDRGAKESISILSSFYGDKPGKKEIDSINYLIANAPTTFLSEYSEKDWARDYLKAAIDRSLSVISPLDFVKYFRNKPWFDSNSGSVAKSLSEQNPHYFLKNYANEHWAKEHINIAAESLAKEDPYYFLVNFMFTNKPWAQDYIPLAAKNCAEKQPYDFLEDFADKPWAKNYIPTAAKNFAESDPFNFLYKFIDKPWAKLYIPIAAKNLAERKPFSFLDNFINEPWAQIYLPIAAESLAEKNPSSFIENYINEPWAKEHIPTAAKNCAEMYPTTFLKYFINEPWAEPYIHTAAENYAKKDLYDFLSNFSKEDWAEPYLSTAAEKLAKEHPFQLLSYFINEPWAKEYIPTAAKNLAESDPDTFLYKFADKPWAKDYIELAQSNRSKENQDSISPTASNRSTKILKLSKALLSLGHIKEMIVIRSLVSE